MPNPFRWPFLMSLNLCPLLRHLRVALCLGQRCMRELFLNLGLHSTPVIGVSEGRAELPHAPCGTRCFSALPAPMWSDASTVRLYRLYSTLKLLACLYLRPSSPPITGSLETSVVCPPLYFQGRDSVCLCPVDRDE